MAATECVTNVDCLAMPDTQAGAGRDTAVGMQQAALELLAQLCSVDSRVCQVLVDAQGLGALLSMMPDPPPAPPEAAAWRTVGQQQAELDAAQGSGTSCSQSSGSNGVPPLPLAAVCAAGANTMHSPHQASVHAGPFGNSLCSTPPPRGHCCSCRLYCPVNRGSATVIALLILPLKWQGTAATSPL